MKDQFERDAYAQGEYERLQAEFDAEARKVVEALIEENTGLDGKVDHDGILIALAVKYLTVRYELTRRCARSAGTASTDRVAQAYELLEQHKRAADFREADQYAADLVAMVIRSDAEVLRLIESKDWGIAEIQRLKGEIERLRTQSATEPMTFDRRGEVPILIDRDDVLEEAALACEACDPMSGQPDTWDECAAAIRALKSNASVGPTATDGERG